MCSAGGSVPRNEFLLNYENVLKTIQFYSIQKERKMINTKLNFSAWASDPPSDVGKSPLHSFEKQTFQHSLSPSSSTSQPELSPLSSS